MRNNRGVTLIILVITIIILTIIAGVIVYNFGETYENSRPMQFNIYMKMIQKKVDIYVEEGTDYMSLGQTLSSGNQSRLQAILDSDTQNQINTTDATSTAIRYFNSNDINTYFDISEINDEIVVNFANREVISLNGIEKNGMMVYVEK